MTDFITIIVCTYNRGEILIDCLNALCEQNAPKEQYEILIVDNNSTDSTEEISKDFINKYPNIRYFKEIKQGLSHARNAGYLNTNSDWVGYMDDDGKVAPDYITESFKVINNYEFDCFGGRYTAWYPKGKPKWLSDSFGTSDIYQNRVCERLEGHNSGGIIFFKKSVLENLGGFDVNFGMAGTKTGYGEETRLQILMQEKGYKIGYSPFIRMEHLVADYKLNVWWQIKQYYALGRDNNNLWGTTLKLNFFSLAKLSLSKFVNQVFSSTIKMVRNKDYYIQNAVIDTLQPIAYIWGDYFRNK